MKIYKRVLILVLIILCVFLLDYGFKYKKGIQQEDITEVFNQSELILNSAKLCCYGKYKSNYMNEIEMKELVEGMATALKLQDYETNWLEEEDQKAFTIYKEAKNAHTKIQLLETYTKVEDLTYHVNNYFFVEIQLDQQWNSISYYEDIIREYCEKHGINPLINVTSKGNRNGKLENASATRLMEEMIASLGGTCVYSEQVSNAMSALGYTKSYERYLQVDGKRVNIHVALSYDEELNQTLVTLATPIIASEF